MRILFAIQGTGNGHLSRARDVYPQLATHGDVDVLISGIQADVAVPFPVKYHRYGMSFIFGRHGGVAMWDTARKLRLSTLIKDVRQLPVNDYDLVINDFEPVSSWACKINKKPCIALSHQSAVLHPNAPQPAKSDWMGKLVLRRYAPYTKAYGFHFKEFGENIFTPVIRKSIRELVATNDGHYTVYLPAYDDELLVKHLSHFDSATWHVFSKHNKKPFAYKNLEVQPIENDAFVKSMASAAGLLCGAGFEGPAEAMYLGKKVMVIPMQSQYEQHCNAAAAALLGVSVIDSLSEKCYGQIGEWLMYGKSVQVNYPDITADIVARVVRENTPPVLK